MEQGVHLVCYLRGLSEGRHCSGLVINLAAKLLHTGISLQLIPLESTQHVTRARCVLPVQPLLHE